MDRIQKAIALKGGMKRTIQRCIYILVCVEGANLTSPREWLSTRIIYPYIDQGQGFSEVYLFISKIAQ